MLLAVALFGCTGSTIPAAANDPVPLDGKAVKLDALGTDKYLHYVVGASIAAPPHTVWEVLVDAPGYPAWNSTVVKIDGKIAKDEKIELTAKVAADRVFPLTVSTFDVDEAMVWEDGSDSFRGVRTFTLTPRADGGTDFTMREAFTGSMVGFIAGMLPDFTEDFEGFTADLKKEAEKRVPPPPEPEEKPTLPVEPPEPAPTTP
jgi:uncharacterized protein YndB with AHSA1/START domain